MSRRANPKIVGGFILAAIGLLVAAALVFGTFTFFEVTRRFVVFFQGSVDGLTQGSAVLFRGVLARPGNRCRNPLRSPEQDL
jgi:ABC-type transporter Mla subunit MlaD